MPAAAHAPLPVVPLPVASEAFTSWAGRVAARYDLGPDDLAEAAGAPGAIGPLHDHAVPGELAAALGTATGLGGAAVASLGLSVSLPVLPSAWMRAEPSWCQACVAEAAARDGEVNRAALWSAGPVVFCPLHGTPLRTAADFEDPRAGRPCCSRPALGFTGMGGRLRLACAACGALHEGWDAGAGPPFRAMVAAPAAEFQQILLRAAAGGVSAGGWSKGLAPEVALAVAADACGLALEPMRLLSPNGGPYDARLREEYGAGFGAWTPARVTPRAAAGLFAWVAWLLDDAPDQGLGGGPDARELRPRFRGLRVLRAQAPMSDVEAAGATARWPARLREAFCTRWRD